MRQRPEPLNYTFRNTTNKFGLGHLRAWRDGYGHPFGVGARTVIHDRHFWKRVAKVSYEKYKVKLNAVAHDGCYSMYSYLTVPTPKKQLAELDQEIFLSEHHPRGKMLRNLLEHGAVHARASKGRKRQPAAASSASAEASSGKRFRMGDVYELVTKQGVKTALDLQNLACQAFALSSGARPRR